jgi:hypothetical protein
VRANHIAVGAVILTLTSAAAYAQAEGEALTPLQMAVACTLPSAVAAPRPIGLRVAGAQDTVARSTFGPGDLIMLSGGARAGLQLGQRFYVRRPVTFGGELSNQLHAVRTAGWVRIVAMNDTTAIATVEVACAAIMQGDYLDQFVAPVVPDGADLTDASGQPDFSALGHVMFGNEEVPAGGAGDFMLIDRGMSQGLRPGARLAVYRDLQVGGLPLTWIGEGIVISTSPQTALMRITSSRDAVQTGDFVAIRK